MFKFITSRPFWVNLLAALLLAFLMLVIFLQLLGMITRHGKYLTVPSVLGKKTTDAIKFLEDKGFEVLIKDSVYTDTAKMGTVLRQLPDPNSTVKINRTVFLTVNRLTLPMIEMPALEGKTLSFALNILERSHLKLGDTTYETNFMRGSVLSQSYRGGKIAVGTKIPWGSSIDLAVGSGLGDQRIKVPSLLGLSFAEAKELLQQEGITMGALIVDPGVTDTLAAFVYAQNPPKLTEDKQPFYIQSGQFLDIWVSKEMKVVKDSTGNQ